MGNSRSRFLVVCLLGGLSFPMSAQSQSLELTPAKTASFDKTPLAIPRLKRELSESSLPDGEQSLLDSERSLLDPETIESETADSQWGDESGEKVQQRYPNGKLHIERSIVEDEQGNFVNHGSYVEYDAKGEVIRSGSFASGKMDGQWKQVLGLESIRGLTDNVDPGFQAPFHSNTTFNDGEISDAWTIADAKGKLVFILQFEDGQRENLSIWYNSRGDVVRELMYSANVPDGAAVVIDPKTKKPTPITIQEGLIVQTKTEWHDPKTRKTKKSEGSVLVPYAFTIEDHDWWNSKIKMVPATTAEPIRHGLVSSWHANGQLAFHSNYVKGKLDGESTWYYDNGQPMGRGMSKDDVKVGEWTWWHSNGMKQASGSYDEGIAAGIWSTWGQDGQLLRRGDAQTLVASGEDFYEPVQVATDETPIRSAKRVELRPSSVRRSTGR
jgi:antitoxin component YwqK of YwqJK toxin-antitoxin module